MKRSILLLLVLFCYFKITAATITVTQNGDITLASTFDLGRVPMGGDNIVVPSPYSLQISSDFIITGAPVNFYIYGGASLIFIANGGQPGKLDLPAMSNVFLFTGGSITGTQNSERIRIGNNTIYTGVCNGGDVPGEDCGTITGPRCSSSTGFIPCTPTVLPVSFLYFKATANTNLLVIEWKTGTEYNSDYFVIEKSENGNVWQPVATVRAKGFGSLYTYYDALPKVNSYYRVCSVDKDFKKQWSSISLVKSLHLAAKGWLQPKIFKLFLPVNMGDMLTLKIVGASGKTIFEKQISGRAGILEFNHHITTKGMYAVSLSNKKGKVYSEKFILH